MSNPVCISPLKFYDSPAKQNHRKSYAYGHISPLITKTGWIPPFQFVIPTQDYINGGNVIWAQLFNAKTDTVAYNLPQTYFNDNFSVETLEGYKVFKHKGLYALSEEKAFVDGYLLEDGYIAPEFIDSYKTSDYIPIEKGKSYYVPHFRKLGFFNTSKVIDDSNFETNERSDFYFSAPYDGYVRITYFKTDPDERVGFYERGQSNILHIPSEGQYYLKLTSNNGGLWTYYSEVFCFDNITKDCLELEYWNETGNFAVKNGIISFTNGFHFKMLLKGEIGKPEYNFEEESTKRLGYVFVESQVSKKTYKFNAVVPEYICDALRLVRLCDNKIIRCKDDEYEAITFEMEAEWQTQGDLASVTCEFETDNVVANIGGFVPDKLGGDYNNDYNEDFDKE